MKILLLLLVSFATLAQTTTYSTKTIYKQRTYHLSISKDVKGVDTTYSFLYKDMRYPVLDQYDGFILGTRKEGISFFIECLKVFNKANKEERTNTVVQDENISIFYDKDFGIGTLVIFKQNGGLTKVLKSHLAEMIAALNSN